MKGSYHLGILRHSRLDEILISLMLGSLIQVFYHLLHCHRLTLIPPWMSFDECEEWRKWRGRWVSEEISSKTQTTEIM